MRPLLPGAVATSGNQNNELGVPLTAVQLKADNDFLVLEMGARGVGHLSYLCDIAPPHVGTVLAVGSAHVGAFGSLELTAAAKGELPAALPGDGVAVLNADDPRVTAMPTPARVLTFGVRGDVTWRDVCLDRLDRPSFSLGYAGMWQPVRLRQSGAHQVANACAAAAAALAVGEQLPAIAHRLCAVQSPSPMRMRRQLDPRVTGPLTRSQDPVRSTSPVRNKDRFFRRRDPAGPSGSLC
ncbi:MAG TPA: Mur ligase family protein [Candidatus Limnocylindrales bacterium]|nr:Mur ligase family protein [Candidatus Limnocylindrales bacterium]